jgi:hypothetical protein
MLVALNFNDHAHGIAVHNINAFPNGIAVVSINANDAQFDFKLAWTRGQI